MEWLSKNVEWVFSGVGVAIVAGILAWFRRNRSEQIDSPSATINNTWIRDQNVPER